MSLTPEAWCRSCGAAAKAEHRVCGACGTPLDGSDPGPDWIGTIVKVSGGLRTKWGIIVSSDGPQLTVETKPGEAAQLDLAAVQSMERQRFTGDDLPTAAGRLMGAHLATQQNQVKGKWNADGASNLAWALGTQTLGRKRAAVLDWLVLGLVGHVEAAGLSVTEVAWYRARHASMSGDVVTLVEQLQLLPREGYAARLDLIQRHLHDLRSEPARAKAVAESLEVLADQDERAKALVVVLTAGSMPERIAAAEVFTSRLAETAPEVAAQATSLTAAMKKGAFTDPEGLPLPLTRAVALWTTGRQGEDLDGRADDLAALPLSMVDDLVDAGALTGGALGAGLFSGPHGPYLTARVSPGSLTIEQAYQLEFVSEYARRLFLLGDLERLTQFPPGEPDADHYIALLNLKNNPTAGYRDGLRPKALELLAIVDQYLERLAEGDEGLPPQEVLADPTLWRLLRADALKGRIQLSDEDRASAPHFAAWRDLVEMQRLCFAGEWSTVRTLGLRLKDELTEEALRDEALNMAAYAAATLGQHEEALTLLEDALEGTYTEALVINTSIVATELGSERAASFLARIYEEAPDRDLAAKALLKGVGLWFSDDSSETIPPPLVSSLRRALQEPQPDDSLRLFLNVASDHDAAWLAKASVTATTPEQREMVAVFHAWAGAKVDGPITINDVAQALVPLNKRESPPMWATKELERLIGLLIDLVHVDFGDGAWLVGAVRTLADARLLNLVQETVLTIQVGTHVAVRLELDGEEIAPKAEVDLIFAPVERWHAEKSDLPEGLIEIVDDEVGRCLARAALAMAIVTERHRVGFGREWDALVQRERWDSQNRYAILREEDRILTECDGYVDRCRRYLQRLNRFPIPAEAEEIKRDVARMVDEWSRENARLRSYL